MRNSARLLTTTFSLLAILAFSAGLAQAQMETFAYVTNADDDSVSVFKADGSFVTAIDLGVGSQPYGVAAAPDGTRVYVTNSGLNTVSVIDTATNTVVGTLEVETSPKGIAVTPDGTKVFVINNSYYDGSVSVIELLTGDVTNTPVFGTSPIGIAFTPELVPRAYVTNTGSSNITVIDTVSNAVLIPSISAGGRPKDIAIDSDGFAYVALSNWGLSVINTRIDTNNARITFSQPDTTPAGVAVSVKCDNAGVCVKRVYETDNENGWLRFGDFSGMTQDSFDDNVVSNFYMYDPGWDTVGVGPAPIGVAVTPDQTQVWVANNAAETLTIFSIFSENGVPTSPGFIKSVGTGAKPTWIAFATVDTGGGGPVTHEFDLALRRVKIFQRGWYRDYFWVSGRVTLDADSDGLNLTEEASSLTIGPTTFKIPAFKSRWRGRLLFFRGTVEEGAVGEEPNDEAWMQVYLYKSRSEGRYYLTVFGKKAQFPGITRNVTVRLELGNDFGEDTKRAYIH